MTTYTIEKWYDVQVEFTVEAESHEDAEGVLTCIDYGMIQVHDSRPEAIQSAYVGHVSECNSPYER